MMTSDDALRKAFAGHSRQALPDGHLDAEVLWHLAVGELSGDGSRKLIDHLSRCPSCAEDFRVTRRLVGETSGTSESVVVETSVVETSGTSERVEEGARIVPIQRKAGVPSQRKTGMWLRGLAAAAVLGALVVGLSWRSPPTQEVPFRQGGSEVVRSRLDGDAVVSRQDAQLQWTGPEGAHYNVLVTVDLRVIATAEGLTEPEYVIPESKLGDLPAETLLHWHVEAVLPDGGRIPSETFDLRLADE